MEPPKPEPLTKRRFTRRDLVWIVPSVGTVGFFGWFFWRLWYIRLRSKPAPGPAVWKEGPKVPVAALGDWPRVWSKYYFDYPYAGGNLPAIAVRVPAAVEGGLSVGEVHLVALSRICTHQSCKTNYVPDPEAGAIAYNYRSETPFMGCPCHFGAFDPAKAGQAVYGPPSNPLPRLRLELLEGRVFATAHETPLRPLEAG